MSIEPGTFERYCLAVKGTTPEVLPRPLWKPEAWLLGEIFGCQLAYFNPKITHPSRPVILKEAKIGFYGITPPFPSKMVCEIRPECIDTIAILPMLPGEAATTLSKTDWDALMELAIHKQTFRIHLVAAQSAAA